MASSGEEQIDILIETLNAEESKKEITDTTEYVKQRIQGVRDLIDRIGKVPLPASFVMGGKKQIDELMDTVSGRAPLEDFQNQIAGMDEWDLTGLRNEILKTIDVIADLKVPENIKIDPLVQLEEKFQTVNESLNRFWDDQDRQAQSNKVEQFLGRYKFALLLIGGAIGGIVGMMKYSSVFGTMMDLVGQSVGYLADLILSPLIPALVGLVELIIALGDLFSSLPEPIQQVISSIFALAVISKIAGVLIGSGLILGIIKGILAGLIVVYALMQIGALDAVGRFAQTFREQYPLIYDAIAVLLAPFAFLGIIINDLLSGQVDKIPEHFQIAGQMAANYVVAMGARILAAVTGFIGPVISLLMQDVAIVGMIVGGLIASFGLLGDAIFDAFATGVIKALEFFKILVPLATLIYKYRKYYI